MQIFQNMRRKTDISVPKTNAKQLGKIAKMEICEIGSLKELLENLF